MRMRQVLDNLLANVRTHCPEGTSAVVEIVHDPGGVTSRSTDDGPGIDEEQAARVFERFFRVDPSRSRLHGGSGLGLSIVASIVEAHRRHGDCWPRARQWDARSPSVCPVVRPARPSTTDGDSQGTPT